MGSFAADVEEAHCHGILSHQCGYTTKDRRLRTEFSLCVRMNGMYICRVTGANVEQALLF